MDDEEIENQLYEARRIEQLGFMDKEHFKQFLFDAAHGLSFAQDRFANCLGTLLLCSDLDRSMKLIWAFKQDLEQAAMFWRMAEAKRKTES